LGGQRHSCCCARAHMLRVHHNVHSIRARSSSVSACTLAYAATSTGCKYNSALPCTRAIRPVPSCCGACRWPDHCSGATAPSAAEDEGMRLQEYNSTAVQQYISKSVHEYSSPYHHGDDKKGVS
jgi:hypothetical protein